MSATAPTVVRFDDIASASCRWSCSTALWAVCNRRSVRTALVWAVLSRVRLRRRAAFLAVRASHSAGLSGISWVCAGGGRRGWLRRGRRRWIGGLRGGWAGGVGRAWAGGAGRGVIGGSRGGWSYSRYSGNMSNLQVGHVAKYVPSDWAQACMQSELNPGLYAVRMELVAARKDARRFRRQFFGTARTHTLAPDISGHYQPD